MKIYKIRHVRTGLYYTPNRNIKLFGCYFKTNLNKDGKCYLDRKPALPTEIYNHKLITANNCERYMSCELRHYEQTKESDWVIEMRVLEEIENV